VFYANTVKGIQLNYFKALNYFNVSFFFKIKLTEEHANKYVLIDFTIMEIIAFYHYRLFGYEHWG